MDTSKSAAARLLMLVALVVLAACAAPQSFVMVGAAHPPISPAEVKIYSHPPPTFEEIAILNASSNSVFSPGGQSTVDKVIQRLKEQAAKLGANGIILEGFSDSETGSLGTGVGSSSVSSNSAVGVGVGGSLGIYKKSGQGRAIFVPPG
jgi:ABC-type sugar transport system substrate-binding protein